VRSLRLPAREASLPALRQLALDGAKHAGLDHAAIQRVDLVLEEALMNVIRHAYAANALEQFIMLDCGLDADGVFRLVLTDWGAAFDPVAVPVKAPELEASLEANLEADLEHRTPGGLGLFFLRSMAQASYDRKNDANVLTLRFPGKATR